MNQSELENLYLRAKIAYYEGNEILTDAEFDAIEAQLVDMGSKVMEQVGSKRKDFDLSHPTKMLSLAKIQTEENDNKKNEFNMWYTKRMATISSFSSDISPIGILPMMMEWTPKYDGNAINCVYKGGKLVEVLTRGDGYTGKDITNKLANLVPQQIILDSSNIDETIEVRCEAVMPLKSFEEINKQKEIRGEQLFANARNFVAGLLGKDEIETETLKKLVIIPLHLIVNGEHKSITEVMTSWGKMEILTIDLISNYDEILKGFEELRTKLDIGLDGIVVSFPSRYRKLLGENGHDPEWAISIKFVPKETIATVAGVEWNVSKTGELSPVVLFEPVALDGTMVKRASGYNAGYLRTNKLGKGAKVTLAKAGDIIPEIQKVILPSEMLDVFPSECPVCGYPVTFDGIHLSCTNDVCEGKMLKRLGIGLGVFDIKRVGGRSIAPFVGHFDNFVELFIWVRKNAKNPSAFEPFDFKLGSRSLEIFIEGFVNIKSISFAKIIQSLGYDEVGNSISPELAKFYCGLDADFKGFEKAVVQKMKQPEIVSMVMNLKDSLQELGINVEVPTAVVEEELPVNTMYVEMTGSPKPTWKTKEEFIEEQNKKIITVVHVGLNDKRCNLLLTDSYSSTSGKMGVAKKKGIDIMTYEDFNKSF